MTRLDQIKRKFDEAKTAILYNLSDADTPPDLAQLQAAFDDLCGAFDTLFFAALSALDEIAAPEQTQSVTEYMCVQAVNSGDAWGGADWRVVRVNGQTLPDPECAPTVREFTRQMLAQGWKTANPHEARSALPACQPNDTRYYELYFCREQSCECQDPLVMQEFSETSSHTTILSAN